MTKMTLMVKLRSLHDRRASLEVLDHHQVEFHGWVHVPVDNHLSIRRDAELPHRTRPGRRRCDRVLSSGSEHAACPESRRARSRYPAALRRKPSAGRTSRSDVFYTASDWRDQQWAIIHCWLVDNLRGARDFARLQPAVRCRHLLRRSARHAYAPDGPVLIVHHAQ